MKIQSELMTAESNTSSSAKETFEGSFSDSLAVKINELKLPVLVAEQKVSPEVALQELPSLLMSEKKLGESAEAGESTETAAEIVTEETEKVALGIDLLSLMNTPEALVTKESIFFQPDNALKSNSEVALLDQSGTVPVVTEGEELQGLLQSEVKLPEKPEPTLEQTQVSFAVKESADGIGGTAIKQQLTNPQEANEQQGTLLLNQRTSQNNQDPSVRPREDLVAESPEDRSNQEKPVSLLVLEKEPQEQADKTNLNLPEVKLNETNLNLAPFKTQEASPTLPNTQPLRVNFEENVTRVNQVLTEQAETLTEGQTSTLKLTLQPEKLGQLEVVLKMEDGKVTAKFLVENQKVKQLFEQNMPKLEQSLAKQDWQITKMEVVLQKSPQESLNFAGQFNQQQSQQEQRQKMTKQGQQYKLKEAKFEVVEQAVSADSVDILV